MSQGHKRGSAFLKAVIGWGLLFGTVILMILKYLFPENSFLDGAFKIFLSGLVGFGTNFLAIRMLFRPYEKTRFGRQGLIPKEKKNLSASLSERVETDLMHPEILIEHLKRERYLIQGGESLSRWIEEKLNDEGFVEKMRQFILKQYEVHAEKILRVIGSFLDGRIKKFMNENFSGKSLASFLRPYIKDILSKPETVSGLARKILQVIQENMPAIRAMIDEMIEQETANKSGGVFGWIASKFKQFGAWAFNLNGASIADKIESFLRKESSREFLEEKLLGLLEQFGDFMGSEDGRKLMNQVYEGLKKEVGNLTHTMLLPHMRKEIDQFLNDREAVRKTIPRIQEGLKKLSRRLNGRLEEHSDKIHAFIGEKILPNLKLKEMIEKHLVKQDVKNLETMIREVSHSSLDFIEIAGGFLGMIAGVFLISVPAGAAVVAVGSAALGLDSFLTGRGSKGES